MKANYNDEGNVEEEEEDQKHVSSKVHKSNVLPLWGNDRTMNLNPLILTNIQSSHYFKVNLYELKTYHEVIDEIYYKVGHLEPWEKGSRKTAGQTGMCGGVRGVGAGGIVSTAYCLLYKLFTLKLSRKQLNGLITHPDSPYIRALGFMYIRYTQPPGHLWDWYDEYLDDPEELDVKAGGGQVMTIGNILKNFLCKLEWFSTLFPRIPVPIQQQIEKNMNARYPNGFSQKPREPEPEPRVRDKEAEFRRATERDRSRFLEDSSRRPERSPERSSRAGSGREAERQRRGRDDWRDERRRSSPPGDSRRRSSPPGDSRRRSPLGDCRRRSPLGDSRRRSPPGESRRRSPPGDSRRRSPIGDSRRRSSPPGDSRRRKEERREEHGHHSIGHHHRSHSRHRSRSRQRHHY